MNILYIGPILQNIIYYIPLENLGTLFLYNKKLKKLISLVLESLAKLGKIKDKYLVSLKKYDYLKNINKSLPYIFHYDFEKALEYKDKYLFDINKTVLISISHNNEKLYRFIKKNYPYSICFDRYKFMEVIMGQKQKMFLIKDKQLISKLAEIKTLNLNDLHFNMQIVKLIEKYFDKQDLFNKMLEIMKKRNNIKYDIIQYFLGYEPLIYHLIN